MTNILQKLSEGDLRTTGRSEEVVEDVMKNPELFPELFSGLTNEDTGIRMRSADALEKISAQNSQLLQPYTKDLIKIAEEAGQQEVQWHIAQMFSYIELTDNEKKEVLKILAKYFHESKSNIVKVMSLQTMFNIGRNDLSFKNTLLSLLDESLKSEAASVRSRAKRLKKEL